MNGISTSLLNTTVNLIVGKLKSRDISYLIIVMGKKFKFLFENLKERHRRCMNFTGD